MSEALAAAWSRRGRVERVLPIDEALGALLPAAEPFEIVEFARLAPCPGAAEHFAGLIAHRGQAVPVYDLRLALGLAPGAWVRRRVLVFASGPEAVGVRIEALPHTVERGALVETADPPPLPDAWHTHLRRVWRADQRFLIELDWPALFDDLAAAAVAEASPPAARSGTR